MTSGPSDLDYRRANTVLRRAALSTLMGGLVGAVLLTGLVVLVTLKADYGRLGWPFWLCIAALAAWLFGWSRTTYDKLARLRVTDAGFELRDKGGHTLVPWHAIQEIEIGTREFRIRAPGHRTFAVSLAAVPDPSPLLAILSAKKPTAIRLGT